MKWYVFNDGKDEKYVNKPYIEKHSKNIIDLIEVGDYVNGYPVAVVFPSEVRLNINYQEHGISQIVWADEIKSIVTKEQFENATYNII